MNERRGLREGAVRVDSTAQLPSLYL